MKKTVFFTIVFCACFACNNQAPLNEKKETANPAAEGKAGAASITQIPADSSKAKAWLIGVIESYLNPKDLKDAYNNMRLALTDDYYNYKQDAINLTYDGGDTTMTQESLTKKWESRYNTKFVGKGGFFISGQDNGKVKVTVCDLIKQPEQNSYLFKVVIEDLGFKIKYNRDIRVVKRNNSFLVDDVIEYN